MSKIVLSYLQVAGTMGLQNHWGMAKNVTIGELIPKGWFSLTKGVVVGVVIRRVERYDLVKIKPMESEAEH